MGFFKSSSFDSPNAAGQSKHAKFTTKLADRETTNAKSAVTGGRDPNGVNTNLAHEREAMAAREHFTAAKMHADEGNHAKAAKHLATAREHSSKAGPKWDQAHSAQAAQHESHVAKLAEKAEPAKKRPPVYGNVEKWQLKQKGEKGDKARAIARDANKDPEGKKTRALKKLGGMSGGSGSARLAEGAARARHVDLYKTRARDATDAREKGDYTSAAKHHTAAAIHAEKAGLAEQVAHHTNQAARASERAGGGGDWDESKHPRDEHGKFGG
jgi:hypothetical protein